MKAALSVLLASAALCGQNVLAQGAEQPTAFKPYKLTGDWQFQNTQTGNKYGGDVEISIEQVDDKGVMRGKISFDGRQTNDKCGTKALFTDVPVEAEIVKKGNDYRVNFQLKCQTGVSPRAFSWTLVCADDGACSKTDVQPWGKGLTTLREKR